ncbi:MAG: hypothetical protein ACLFOC_06020 [Campylobacterales bacterium]
MKKLALSLLIAGSTLFANEALMKNMHDMENGMDYIQKGYLYNNMELIKAGVNEIQNASEILKGIDTASYLPSNKKNMVNIAKNSARKMDDALASMEKNLANKEIKKSHEAYSELLTSCVMCHSIVRNW